MRRALGLLLIVALAGAGAALAGRGDPQKRITAADQARAKAMLLKKTDLGTSFRILPALVDPGNVYCKALDESDLTLSGEARSPTFQGGVETVSSLSRVYRSLRDSGTSWRRGTSAGGEKCVRLRFGAELTAQGGELESFGRIAFPRVAESVSSYRLVVSAQGLRVFLDVVGVKQGRAQVALLFGSGLAPMPRDAEVRLARTVARRMKSALRGS
jgi:hypothetical protein